MLRRRLRRHRRRAGPGQRRPAAPSRATNTRSGITEASASSRAAASCSRRTGRCRCRGSWASSTPREGNTEPRDPRARSGHRRHPPGAGGARAVPLADRAGRRCTCGEGRRQPEPAPRRRSPRPSRSNSACRRWSGTRRERSCCGRTFGGTGPVRAERVAVVRDHDDRRRRLDAASAWSAATRSTFGLIARHHDIVRRWLAVYRRYGVRRRGRRSVVVVLVGRSGTGVRAGHPGRVAARSASSIRRSPSRSSSSAASPMFHGGRPTGMLVNLADPHHGHGQGRTGPHERGRGRHDRPHPHVRTDGELRAEVHPRTHAALPRRCLACPTSTPRSPRSTNQQSDERKRHGSLASARQG